MDSITQIGENVHNYFLPAFDKPADTELKIGRFQKIPENLLLSFENQLHLFYKFAIMFVTVGYYAHYASTGGGGHE